MQSTSPSNHNVELSKIINAAMEEFDALPGASGSTLAEAAARDLSGMSCNRGFFRLVLLVAGAILMWQLSALSEALANLLTLIHLPVSRDEAMNGLLVTILLGQWYILWRYIGTLKAERLAKMTTSQRATIDSINLYAKALPDELGMLRTNLMGVSRRMLKIFATQDARLSEWLAHLTYTAIHSAPFAEIAAQEAAIERAYQHLRITLKELLAERDGAPAHTQPSH